MAAKLSPITLLDREQARLYQDVNDVKQPAQIFTIQLDTSEKIDVVMDDYVVGIYYDNAVDLDEDFLSIELPCRANRYMVQAMWDYLNSPQNWPHFVDRSWRQWRKYFLDVGFE